MAQLEQQILRGTLDLLILRAVSEGPAHGYQIARWVGRATDDVLKLEDGSLYPALYRLEDRGYVSAEWKLTEDRRRAKYYRLTASGRKQLREETASWARYARAIFAALDTGATPATA
jgi:PadR family transcriptional regulator PadR